MFDKGTKFKYFKDILREVYVIIEINFKMRDDQMDILLSKIDQHLQKYNSKNGGIVRMGCVFSEDTGELSVFLSDYVRGRGMKKLFEDVISIKSIHRDKLLDMILNDEEEENEENV